MAEVTTKNIELQIKNAAGKSKVVRIADPLTGLDRAATELVADTLIESNLFVDESGDAYSTNVGARYVIHTVDEIYNVKDDSAV